MKTTDTKKVSCGLETLAARVADGSAKILLVGVSCVGKTTVGAALAARLGIKFIRGFSLEPPADSKSADGKPS